MLEEHYFETHHVVLQPSCCAPPSVFQTIMGMELQRRQANFGSFSLRRGNIIGAMCSVQEDKTKLWYVKMPHFEQLGDTSLVAPELCLLDESESDLREYMLEPTDPVVCLPDQDDPYYWSKRRSADECKHGGPGSTMSFWEQSAYIDRLTLGVKTRSTAAFLSMPNKSGVVTGGKSIRGLNDKTVRGYSLWLPLSTRQASDVAQLDEDILRPKGGRHVKDESDEIEDLEKRREAVRQTLR